MPRRLVRLPLLLALIASPLAPLSSAQAAPNASDVESGRLLFKEGMALRRSGNEQAALDKLLAAHELARTPVTGIELARCHIALGQLVEGYSVLRGVVSMPENEETDRTKKARQEARELADQIQPRLGSIVIQIKGIPRGESARLAVDGAPVPLSAMELPRMVNPGKRMIEVSAPGAKLQTREVSVPEGGRTTVEITLVFSAPAPSAPAPASAPPVDRPAPPAEPPAAPASSLRTAGWVTGGVGLGLMGLGGALGLVAKSNYSSSSAGCTGTRCTSADSVSAGNRALSLGTAATVVFVLGTSALLTGGGLVLFAPAPKPESARIEAGIGGPSNLFLRGSF